MNCIVCGHITSRSFNVFSTYGLIGHTVFDDIVVMFGEKVKSVLKPDDRVCNICMNNLDNIAQLINKIWMLITNNVQKPVKTEKIWKSLVSLKNDDVLEDGETGLNQEELENYTVSNSRIPTPSLLSLKHTVLYDSQMEEALAQEQYRSSNNHSVDREVRELFSKKRKKRRRGLRFTHIKKRRTPSTTPRAASIVSTRSYDGSTPLSIFSEDSVSSTGYRRPQYDDQNRLIGNRTRFVAKLQEEEIRDWENKHFRCQVEGCSIPQIEDWDVFNAHMIEDHDAKALYFCDECDARYTRRDLLRYHSIEHNCESMNCLMCSYKCANSIALQAHMDQHLKSNVKCKMCDKSFLSELDYKTHKRRVHKGEKLNRKGTKKNYIIAQYRDVLKFNYKDQNLFPDFNYENLAT